MTARLVVAAVMSVQLAGAPAPTGAPSAPNLERIRWAENFCISKGGIGIVRAGLFIFLKGDRNELRLAGGVTWTGREAGAREVVHVFEGKVVDPNLPPANFDLSKAVVISFEGPIVRFLELATLEGGFYERPGQPGPAATPAKP